MQASTVEQAIKMDWEGEDGKEFPAFVYIEAAHCPHCGALAEARTVLDRELVALHAPEKQTEFIEAERQKVREELAKLVTQCRCQAPKG